MAGLPQTPVPRDHQLGRRAHRAVLTHTTLSLTLEPQSLPPPRGYPLPSMPMTVNPSRTPAPMTTQLPLAKASHISASRILPGPPRPLQLGSSQGVFPATILQHLSGWWDLSFLGVGGPHTPSHTDNPGTSLASLLQHLADHPPLCPHWGSHPDPHIPPSS